MAQKKHTAIAAPTERYLSRELSSLKFNQRVLDQVSRPEKDTFERLKFLEISAANLDEFFMIKVGRLYNYLDYNWVWSNRLGLQLVPFLSQLLHETQAVFQEQHKVFVEQLCPMLEAQQINIVQEIATLSQSVQQQLQTYFEKTLFPILTPRAVHKHQRFPTLPGRTLILGVVLQPSSGANASRQVSFIQIPRNLPRFYRLHHGSTLVPIEVIIQEHLSLLFPNRVIDSITLFRVTRDSNFLLDESDDIAANFVEELQRKLKKRNRSRVVRLELAASYDTWLVKFLQEEWKLASDNLFYVPSASLLDLTSVRGLIQHNSTRSQLLTSPLMLPDQGNLLEMLKHQDILLHHPYNSVDILLNLLEQAADDSQVLAIKITIYRLASQSAIIAALVKAALQGKHVVVVIEIKARFDEENNIQAAQELEEAGCLVIYGTSKVKVHAKMLMILRQEQDKVTQYIHLATGNYNEETATGYADIGLLTTEESYARDVASFFNVITAHASAQAYENLLTAPFDLRDKLVTLIRKEAENAQKGLSAGIVIKVNALEDEAIIDELYQASSAGVPIRLIVRGVCCLVPQKKGLSEHITVRSIVGEFLEHSRIFYFHQQGLPKVYAGSADLMVRSFDKRIEVLFAIKNPVLQQQIMHILAYNLRDNVNSYLMNADGTYSKATADDGAFFNIHTAFLHVTLAEVMEAKLF